MAKSKAKPKKAKDLEFQAQNEAGRSRRSRSKKDFPDPNEIASRQRSLDWGGWIQYLPNPDKVLLNIGRDMTVYDDIKHDPHLTAVISSRKAGVKSMLWEVDRGKSKSRQAKVVIDVFNRLDVHRIMNDILDYFLTGLAPLEVLWDRPNEAGLILPYEVMGKPAEWFMFDGNNVLKFRSINASLAGEEIPPRKILLPRHNPTYKNPYGESLMSTVYWPITFKFGGTKFWIKFAEKFGMPFAIGKVPRSAGINEFNKMAELLEDLVQDAVAAIPDDSKIEFLEASGKMSSAEIYRDLLRFCNEEISKAILGQTLTTEAGDKGARALGTVHMDVRIDIINEDKRVVESCFNELIKWIMEVNFGLNVETPKFTLYEEQDLEADRAARDKLLADTGQVQFTQKYVESAYGFAPDDVVIKEKPAATTGIGPGFNQEFAELVSPFKDQVTIDRLVESIGPEELRRQADFVKPIFALFDKHNNYSEAMQELLTIFSDVHPKELQKVLAKAVFLSDVWGRLNSNA